MSNLLSIESTTSPATIPFRPLLSECKHLTLRECFCQFSGVELRTRSPETVSEYHTHLRRWDEFWDEERSAWEENHSSGGEWRYRMAYPVLLEIGRSELLGFEAWVESNVTNQRGQPVGNRVINKHLGTVASILNWAVKHGLIESIPKVERRKERKSGRKLHLSLAEADALKRACVIAKWPRGLAHPASLYWESLVVGYCLQGFRTQEQVRYESRHRSLTWDCVHWQPETPHEDGKAVNPWGWLQYRPDKNWPEDEPPLTLPMHEAYHVHLRALESDTVEVFPFPLSNSSFYDQWHEIVREAGIAPKANWRGESTRYQVMHLRKSAVKWINDAEARSVLSRLLGEEEAEGDKLVSTQAIGHTDAVARKNYDFDDERLVLAYQSLVVPDSFRQPLTGGTRQLTLF